MKARKEEAIKAAHDAYIADQLHPADPYGNSDSGEQRIHLHVETHMQTHKAPPISIYSNIYTLIPTEIQAAESNKNR